MNNLRVLSWNILGPLTKDVTWFTDRYQAAANWPHRFERILHKIIAIDPDVICLQEVDLEQKEEFEKRLQHHGYALGSYESKGPHSGVILLYKVARLFVANHGHVQINPYQEFHHASAYAWATLVDKQNKKSILIASAHFQHKHIIEQLDEFLSSLAPLSRTIPFIIIGDFNTKYIAMLKQLLPHLHKANIFAYAIKMFEHGSWTHQSTMKQDNIGGWSSVDHMIYTDNLILDHNNSFVGTSNHSYKTDLVYTATHNIIDHTMHPAPSEEFPSDHLPLIATISFSEH